MLGTNVEKGITLPSSFHDKKLVSWLTENSNANTIKASISNYSATITMNKSPFSGVRDTFETYIESGNVYKIMYSTNFYDFDSEQFHRIMLQEKLNGSSVL